MSKASALFSRHLYIVQRASAMLLGPLVIVHLLLIMIAIKDGLSATEILGRTRGNYGWGAFYTLFVLAVSLHAPVGVRNILNEWTSVKSGYINVVSLLFGAVLLFTGLRAVVAVV